jgi:hypothetical protein
MTTFSCSALKAASWAQVLTKYGSEGTFPTIQADTRDRRQFPESALLAVSSKVPALQTILNLCIPDKELAKTHSQSSFIYVQSHL